MSARTSERGAALVVTLIFTAAMAAAAVAFIAGRQTDSLALRGQLQGVEAQAMLEAALQQTVAVLNNRDNGQRIPPQLTWQFGDVTVRVELASESGKVDLNKAEKPLLQGLAKAVGMGDDQAAALADSVLDWRDEDKAKLAHGAEGSDYRGAGLGSSGPANRPFSHPAELRYVLPVDAATWALLAPFVTVYSGEAEPEASKAAPPVRRAMGIAQSLAQSTAQEAQTDQSSAVRSTTGSATESETTAGRLSKSDSAPSSLSSLSRSSQAGSSSGAGATAGKLSGNATNSSTLSKLDSPSDRRQRDGAAAGTDDFTGVQTVVLDVRFPNGYEAAAKAVIVLDTDGGEGEPFTVLDWAPIVRPRSSET